MPGADADEAALLRAAHNLKPGAELPEEVVAAAAAETAPMDDAVTQPSATTLGQP